MKTITKNIALFIITLGILSSPFSVHAATWVGPTATPPGNNVSAPVNVGGTYQIKAGDLGVISLFANYIKSLGTISANRYCFNNGTANGRDQNCITSWPAGGTGGGIQSVVAGTNVTVDNTDPANPVVSSTATGGTSGVIVRKDGVPVLAPATTLNFTGSNITTTPSGGSVSIAVTPAVPTAIRKDGIQVSAAPLALDFTGSNITAQNVGGVVKINVAPATPTAIQKDGIQVSAAPLAVNFVGDNITATNTGGIVSVGVNKLTVQKDGINVGAGNNFKGINFNFNGTNGWDIQNDPSGIAQVNYYGDGSAGEFLPAATPADKILRSDGNDWVQSPLVKTTVSSFQVNRPVADNSTDNIFQAAKMYNIFGNAIPLTGLFVTKDGDTYVNGAKFRNYYNGGTTATPTNSFGADDIFQVTTNASNTGSGLAVRGDAKVRVRGELSSLNNAVVPLSAGLFLGANDIFHVVGELNGAKKGFGLAVDGTTRVEGILAVNGGQALIGDMIHMGNTTQTGNVNQTGNYTMQGAGATMTLGNSTNAAQLNITGNASQTGDYNQTGNYTQDGNYTLDGNIVQTGNINTTGRWAVNDAVGSISTPALSVGGNPPSVPSLPYSFKASITSPSNNKYFGLNRAGETVVKGSLSVFGPSSFVGDVSIWGDLDVRDNVRVGTLENTSTTELHVCVSQNGQLQLCTLPQPDVDITSTGFTGNSFFNVYDGNSQSSFPSNPAESTTFTYQVKNATSCNRETTLGSTTGWNATNVTPNNTVVFQPFSVGGTVTSQGPTTIKVTCFNSMGQSSSDSVTVYGQGSYLWTSPGVRNYSFPAGISVKGEIWGGGGGGGGSYFNSQGINSCGGGGGGGAGEYEAENSLPSSVIVTVGGAGSGGSGVSASSGSYGNANAGSSGGLSKITNSGGTLLADAGGGNGGNAGGVNDGDAFGGNPGYNYGNGGSSGGASDGTGSCYTSGGGGKYPSWGGLNNGAALGGAGAGVSNSSVSNGSNGTAGALLFTW